MAEQLNPSLDSDDSELTLTPIEFIDQVGTIIKNINCSDYKQGPYLYYILCLRGEPRMQHPFHAIDQDLYPLGQKAQIERVEAIARPGRLLDVKLQRGANVPIEHKRVTIVEQSVVTLSVELKKEDQLFIDTEDRVDKERFKPAWYAYIGTGEITDPQNWIKIVKGQIVLVETSRHPLAESLTNQLELKVF